MNITVGNYETKNFDIYSPAAVAFGEFHSTDKNTVACVEHAAKYVDIALGILKKALAAGSLNTHDLDELIENIDLAEEQLDECDELDQHYYLRDHLEPMAIEMYDLNDIDPDDHAHDYADEEEGMFGEPSEYDSAGDSAE